MNQIILSPAKQALGFAGWLALCFATSALGAIASTSAGAFYAEMARPAWAPPGWVFGPVWSVLFLTMAIAVWLVWRVPHHQQSKAVALRLFVIQLAANALWSWLFFAWHLGGAAFAEVLLLWILIACTIGAFWRVNAAAGLLMVPYLLWVTFASALNWVLWQANPGLLG
ncbi:MAG: TspO/MBR family protein [Burkholderiales bacterium]